MVRVRDKIMICVWVAQALSRNTLFCDGATFTQIVFQFFSKDPKPQFLHRNSTQQKGNPGLNEKKAWEVGGGGLAFTIPGQPLFSLYSGMAGISRAQLHVLCDTNLKFEIVHKQQ